MGMRKSKVNAAAKTDTQRAPHIEVRYGAAEAMEILGISRTHFYKRVAEGRLHLVYDGKRPYVTEKELRRYARTSHPVEPVSAEPQPENASLLPPQGENDSDLLREISAKLSGFIDLGKSRHMWHSSSLHCDAMCLVTASAEAALAKVAP
jgi:hypothetical protein